MLNKLDVRFKRTKPNANELYYATEFAAGADLRACLENEIIIKPKEVKKIPTGIALEIPTSFVGLVYARSGLASKFMVSPINKVGVIDSDYRGEIFVFLYNESNEDFKVCHGDRIAQLVICPYYTANFIETNNLDCTKRGEKGFGSSGIK